MPDVTDKQYKALVTEVKKNPGQSERHYAEAAGIPQSKLLPVLVRAELEANPKLKIAATGPAILKAKKSGLRWPRVAGYAGVSVSRAKELFAEAGGSEEDAYTGRGRKTSGVAGTSGRRSSGTARKAASTGTSGRRGAASKKTSSTTQASGRKAGRRGTRAQAANPQ